MSLSRMLLRRVALGLATIWGVLTLVFVLFTQTRDWNLGTQVAMAGRDPGTDSDDIAELREEYLAERGMDRPLWEQYVDWMGDMVTLQWGESFETGHAVLPAVIDATVRTGSYVVPALALATGVGLTVALYTGLNPGSIGDGVLRSASYLSFGLPNFWIGYMIVSVAALGGLHRHSTTAETAIQPTEGPFVVEFVLPVVLVATTLLAAVVSYGRAYSLQYGSSAMTKLIRAKGGSQLDVARHVLRNAAIPLVSLLFAETLALLALAVFVIEALFAIDGLGLLFYNAIWTRDLPVLMGGTMVIVVIGVGGNVLQDLAYSLLDPRVDTGTR
ncbi:ABC transporter permease [Halomontanus rarus]|uniref:ABC transporter permease n=1 Tax=Halomontanus rarus TaxID=3034020 RepID=UPI001F60BD63